MSMSKVKWVKCRGFPMWPSRLCSEPEMNVVLEHKPKAKPGEEPNCNYFAVVYFGKCQKGWVKQSDLLPFDTSSFVKYFDEKKFRLDISYRTALIEAVRIAVRDGVQFEEETFKMISTFKDLVWDRDDICIKCGGTEFSGDSLVCDHCNVSETHFHCLHTPIIYAPAGSWYCDLCISADPRLMKQMTASLSPITPSEANSNDNSRSDSAGTAASTGRRRSLLQKRKTTLEELPTVGAVYDQDDDFEISENPRKRGSSSMSAAQFVQQEVLEVGDVVDVMPRTFPGMNREGGRGTIKKAHGDGTFDVAYILNRSSDKSVPQQYIRLAETSIKRLSQLSMNSYDTTHGLNGMRRGDGDGSQTAQNLSFQPLQNAVTIPTNITSEREEDRCLICDTTGGRLLLCDFPQCQRVYHHVCVFKVGPPVMDMAQMDFDHDGSYTAKDSWFCPAHTCFSCSAIQETSFPLGRMDLPVSWLSSITNSKQRQLKACVSCPLSACSDCITEIGKYCHVFDSKRKEQNTNKCANCISKSPVQMFAMILESIWCKMCMTRLAIPFLRPLLPDDSEGHTISSNCASVLSQMPTDLISVIEKIRSLQYINVKSFRDDLEHLKTLVNQRIERCNDKRNCRSIVHAFDSLVASVDTFIKNRLETLSSLEQSISRRLGDGIEEKTRMQMMWRKECERYPVVSVVRSRIVGRSLSYWALFVETGMLAPYAKTSEANEDSEVIERFLCSIGIDEEMPNNDAAKLLIDFSQGEDCTNGYIDLPDYNSYITQRDDTSEALDMLGGLLKRLSQVQGELRRKHIERKQITSLASENGRTLVTIGEGNALSEMKMANNSLKWRLRQKEQALEASAAIIEKLKSKNKELLLQVDEFRRRQQEDSQRLATPKSSDSI